MNRKKSNPPSDFELDKYGVWVKTKLDHLKTLTPSEETPEFSSPKAGEIFTPQNTPSSLSFDSIRNQIESIKKDLADLRNEIHDRPENNADAKTTEDFFEEYPFSLKTDDDIPSSTNTVLPLWDDFDIPSVGENQSSEFKKKTLLYEIPESSSESLFNDDLQLTEEDKRLFEEETRNSSLPEETTTDLILDAPEGFEDPVTAETQTEKSGDTELLDGTDSGLTEDFDLSVPPDFFEEPIVEEPIVEEPIVEEPMNRFSKNRFSKNRFSKNRFSKNRFSKNRFSKNRLSKNRFLKNRLSKNRFSRNRLPKSRLFPPRILIRRRIPNRLSSSRKTIRIWMTSASPIRRA